MEAALQEKPPGYALIRICTREKTAFVVERHRTFMALKLSRDVLNRNCRGTSVHFFACRADLAEDVLAMARQWLKEDQLEIGSISMTGRPCIVGRVRRSI